LDVVLNKPFKDRVWEKWIAWMKSDDKELTAGGNLKKPGLSLVTSWVKTSWEDIPKEMVVKSFLKTGISNRMDGTEDELLWDSEPGSEGEESDVPADWDTDINITQEEFDKLIQNSHSVILSVHTYQSVKFHIENIFCCFINFYKTNQYKIYKQ